MNGLGKLFRKKSDPKIEKNSNQGEIAVCEQKTTSEEANFCSNTAKRKKTKTQENKKISRCKARFFAPLRDSA